MLRDVLRNKVFYAFPYDMRRMLFSVIKQKQFHDLQHLRTIDTNDGYSLKPFDLYRCIFVHIPKAAGISMSRALFGNLAGNHKSVETYQRIFSQKEFNSYFKFTFVRNPWDRLFSAYIYLKRGGMNEYDRKWAEVNITPYDSFDDFIKRGLQKPNILKWVHFRPQSDLLYVPGSKELQVNFLGLFENIQEDFQYVIKKIRNDGSTILKKENSSNPGGKLDYRDYYTDVTRKIVSIVFKHDIDNFGYSFNNDSLEEQLTTRSQRTAAFHR